LATIARLGDMLAERKTDTLTQTDIHTQTCSLQYFTTATVGKVKTSKTTK